ncbi:TRAP transporter small permease [Mangrovibrevibacter kandeliae]|uniref:TRAP transporter small permease n=1 Tax=Mangrovibrevibacter kandeliae TaxID=2968473 RepID=UPI00211821E4|nr:TRAP transporter small permease [Aurantimonas sp. CSK15Z-1]MCQ8781551.1 TRAP transporter small permease [Aurantimonas sp. CSK15Z-1]
MLKRLAQLELVVAALLLAAIVLLVFAASILRFFDHPLVWSVDLAQLLFIWLCFLGATRALRQKGHIGIDLLVRFLPRPWRLACELAVSGVVLVFLGALMQQGIKLTLLNSARQFGDSGLSYGWVTGAVPAGSVMLMLALLSNMAVAWRDRADGQTLVYTRTSSETAPASEL